MATLVEFKPSELALLPSDLWEMTQQYPHAFNRYFDHLEGHPEPQSDRYEIYFNDEADPAIAWEGKTLDLDGEEVPPFKGEPSIISGYHDNVLVFFEAGKHILLDERTEDFPDLQVLLDG
jgi:hypothetical protein